MERKMCKQKIKVNSIVTVSVTLDQLQYLDLGIGEKGKDMQVCLKNVHNLYLHLTAAWLAQLGECRSANQEVADSDPGWTNTWGL